MVRGWRLSMAFRFRAAPQQCQKIADRKLMFGVHHWCYFCYMECRERKIFIGTQDGAWTFSFLRVVQTMNDCVSISLTTMSRFSNFRLTAHGSVEASNASQSKEANQNLQTTQEHDVSPACMIETCDL